MRPRCHVFVCANARPEGGRPACATRGSGAIAAELTRAVLARGLGAEIAVTTSGCLGPCFEGPNLVVYPQGVWYQGVAVEDVGELVDSLATGTVVDRLLRTDED